MKKLLFIAIAIFSMAACAKVEMPVSNPEASDREINFQVSQFIKTKANTVYDNTVPFGTYSWYTAGCFFINRDESKTLDRYLRFIEEA